MRITVTDRLSFRVDSQRKILDNGYLSVPGRVARTGVQQYTAQELGLTDRPPNELVNVYRPPEEVFKPESLASYDNSDITLQHPDKFVGSTTYKEVSVGHATSAGRKFGEYVVVDHLIKDQGAIDAVNKGTAELSAGYSAEYLAQPGIAPCGTPYEFIQTDIRINHIALCDTARAGHLARLFDSQKPKENQPMPQITLDSGAKVEVADQATATLIQTTFDSLTKKVTDSEKIILQLRDDNETLEAEKEQKDKEIDKLKEETSDAAIQRRVDQVVDAMNGARLVAGTKFSCDSMDPMTIKRQALDAAGIKSKKYGTWDKAPDAYVNAWFDAEVDRQEEEDEPGDEKGEKNTNDSHRRFANDLNNSLRRNTGDASQQRIAARNTFLDQRYGRKPEDKK
ncbi:DUF2213 domain-containing protein [Enterobacter sp. WCHEn045836]|uniref:DUF2213 domain-containing protein n=1 Tax=Enterobacter sp. WCHEn045836 TaxID=2497434 RepID=UPI000F8315D5|nr:DUF2213 domain-containing protein [Enterobacter sp. WCHEn045836]RTQ01290.1 DUF2213 domain-containing protein [Enterobacter sp. WCHEn045836]